jgi:hypothetical protein
LLEKYGLFMATFLPLDKPMMCAKLVGRAAKSLP